MQRPLDGIRVVEISMWGFVPSAGAILSDMGAEVIKIEPPTGDPVRELSFAGFPPGAHGFRYHWEIFNRGKRSIALDLGAEGALEVFHKLLETADVLLTSLLPGARRKLKIDIDDIKQRHPNIIYAIGSGQGAFGPDAEKGGFDFITYWSRAGIASALTPDGADYPPNMPGAAFGDTTCGAMLSGGIAAAIAQRALTGHASVVDVSLLGWGMWALQPGIVGAKLAGLEELPKAERAAMPNPLVNVYRTSDKRFVALTMLQGQRYWPGFCRAIGRPDLIEDIRFSTDAARSTNLGVCIDELDKVFASRTLEEWEAALATQAGQWDVVQKAAELVQDEQAIANTYVQDVAYADGRTLTMVSSPVQFNRQALPAYPAPELGADGDAVLGELGYDEGQIIDLKVAGIVN